MIATLTGMVTEHQGNIVVLEVGFVGYGVLVSSSDQAVLPTGTETKLYIHEHIKEDLHDLIGFKSLSTKQLFEQLLTVKNVGPKGALAVLDIGNEAEVRRAIAGGDVKKLQTAKGVGKRAAEQIVVELRDKVGAPVGGAAEDLVGRAGVDQNDEAVQALMTLGYSDVDAQAALAKIDSDLPVEERVKQALRF
ncbi:Holliday junction branch migration protein RuvA [Candidatus Saccharibacteria bacterium]|nr:MAG: Holliday junction branch migration protein RuvA [Candidatus Saccharibacteria bacterium]